MNAPDQSFHFDEPEFFVAGAIGEPGQRVFHLQTRQGDEFVTVRCEKQHVAALVEHIGGLLADLPPPDADVVDSLEPGLRQPVDDRWVAGGIGLAYDEEVDRIVIAIEELVAADDEGLDDPASGRVAITRAQAAAFVRAGDDLLEQGRPLCHLCGGPMDPVGHVCPRANGYRPPR